MAGEWRECVWGDLATLEYGKGLRGYDSGKGPYLVFGTNGPIGWHDEALCTHPTVIIGRKGAYRGVHFSAGPCFVIDTAFYLEPISEFLLKELKDEGRVHTVGSTRAGLWHIGPKHGQLD
jgi:type I restriction enzyme S subunit